MNNVHVAQILIEHKADLNLTGSKDGSTPLGWCAFKESVEVALAPLTLILRTHRVLLESPSICVSSVYNGELPIYVS